MLLAGEKLGSILAEPRGSASHWRSTAACFNSQPFNLLIECRERDLKTLGRLGLIPIRALQHVNDDAAFNFFQDLEERR